VHPDHEVRPQAGTVYSWSGLPSQGKTESDFPLTAACLTCGRFIIRQTLGKPWEHRPPDAEPVAEPADGGWLAVELVKHGHEITPKPGTVRRERDGEPGNLFSPLDYPLIAECIECGGTVREVRMFLSGGWEHVHIPAQR